MKKISITAILVLVTLLSHSQEDSNLGVFKSDTTWLSEIIKFPISFAPDIQYEGYEDLRFAKNWRAKNHEEFWCYTFAWHITNSNEKQTVAKLETDLETYYDGLMKAVNKKKDFKVPNTTARLMESHGTNHVTFTGKINVYDSFISEDMITLNVTVSTYYCSDKNQSTIVFRLSPKAFSHSIWKRFKSITLKENVCNP